MSRQVKAMKRQRGITLMELMIVMVVVAILAAIAYPSYRGSVMRGQRATAKTALTSAAQALERCFTRFGTYDNAACDVANNLIDGTGFPNTEQTYQISGDVTPAAFLLTATPLGGQTDDTCGSLTLTNTNVQGATGGDAAQCWRR